MDDRGSKQRKGRAEKIREKKPKALQANAAKWFEIDHLFTAASRTSALVLLVEVELPVATKTLLEMSPQGQLKK